jgi:transposase
MGVKKGGRGRLIGRTKGGMNTKLHAICDSKGRPLDLFVTAGQVSDYIGARALLKGLPQVDWLLGDRGYDADWFREELKDKGIRVHPRSKAAQGEREIRQASLQKPQPHRDHVRQTQRLATGRNTV